MKRGRGNILGAGKLTGTLTSETKLPTKAEEARAHPTPTHTQSIHLDPDSTMGFGQLCCVVLCLLGRGES